MSKKYIMKKYKCSRKRRFSHSISCESTLPALSIPSIKRIRRKCDIDLADSLDLRREFQAKEKRTLPPQKAEYGSALMLEDVTAVHPKGDESAKGSGGATCELGEDQSLQEKGTIVQQNGVLNLQVMFHRYCNGRNHDQSLVSSATTARTESDLVGEKDEQKKGEMENDLTSLETEFTRRMRGTKIPDLVYEMSGLRDPDGRRPGIKLSKSEPHCAIALTKILAGHIINGSMEHAQIPPSTLANQTITD